MEKQLIEEVERMGYAPFVPGKNPRLHVKDGVTLSQRQLDSDKLVGSLSEAIVKSGLCDGMTISFHHHFRAGDYIVNMVLDAIAELGIRDLRVAASSLTDCHAPMIEHIKNGVVTSIETSGCRWRCQTHRRRARLKMRRRCAARPSRWRPPCRRACGTPWAFP